MKNENKNIPGKRFRIKFSYVLIILLLAGIGTFTLFRLRLKSKLKARIDAIAAAGYPVTCAELDKWYSIPENAENAAHTIIDAFWCYRELGEIESLPIVGKAKLPARTELLPEDMKAAIAGFVADNNEETVKMIVDAGGKAKGYQVEVSDAASVKSAVTAAANDLGRPSVLVNSAGIGGFFHSHEMPAERWLKIIGVNLNGSFFMAQAVLPYMLEGGGNIVNIASNAGLRGYAHGAAYCASKGGIIQLTRALAEEYIARGVRVNAVAPGGMATPMQDTFTLPEDVDEQIIMKLVTPMGNGDPNDVAKLVAFVASEDGRYMTGSLSVMDGGLTI